MHDLLPQRSRPNVRATGPVAAVIAVALLVLAPLAPAPLAAPIARGADPGIQPRVTGIAPLERQVYGYLPYWRLDSGTVDRLNYNLISTIAMFGLGIKNDGNIDTAWRGYIAYVSDNATAVTNAAHAKGVRVVPTFQLFDSGTLPKMTAFLHSAAAQTRFINQALGLMARRSADGANFDFEPMPVSLAPNFAAFLGRFKVAMHRHFPTATLVAATSAGASYPLIDGIKNIVDQMLVMTYNYRWSGSTVTGAIAPLSNTTRTVALHIAHYLRHVPAAKLILGVPYYGYDWPVTSDVPNAAVNKPTSAWGGVWSVSYASARNFLAAHPEVIRHEDTTEGSAWFTYWDATSLTFRQVYFEDEISVAAKYDFAIANGMAGIGIWTLDNDRGYPEMYDVIRAKFYQPVHRGTVRSSATRLTRIAGMVRLSHLERVHNMGNVPERGTLTWRIFGPTGRLLRKQAVTFTLYPGRSRALTYTTILGTAAGLPAGTYRLEARFSARGGFWTAPSTRFRQPY